MDQIQATKGFVERNKKKLVGLLLFTFVLIIVALVPGIGYEAKVEIAPIKVISGPGLSEHVSIMRLFSGSIKASLNPFLYPISSLCGSNPVYRRFQGASELWDYEGQQVVEMVTLGTFTVEIARNIPYFLAAGYVITLVSGKMIRVVEGKKRSNT